MPLLMASIWPWGCKRVTVMAAKVVFDKAKRNSPDFSDDSSDTDEEESARLKEAVLGNESLQPGRCLWICFCRSMSPRVHCLTSYLSVHRPSPLFTHRSSNSRNLNYLYKISWCSSDSSINQIKKNSTVFYCAIPWIISAVKFHYLDNIAYL